MIIKKKAWNEITKENRALKKKIYELEKINSDNIQDNKEIRVKLIKLKDECSKQQYNNINNLQNKIKSILEETH